MKTIAVIVMKGGAGKTTIALAGAVLADGGALIDLDPQQSAAKIMTRREKKGLQTPLYGAAEPVRLGKALDQVEAAGASVAIIDTPPYVADKRAVKIAADAADLIVVPFKASILDLDALGDTIAAIGSKKRFILVMNQAVANASATTEIIPAVEALLKGTEGILCPHRLGSRVAQADSLSVGQIAPEYAPSSKAAEEMKNVWNLIFEEVKK